jgi:hypothetical protein
MRRIMAQGFVSVVFDEWQNNEPLFFLWGRHVIFTKWAPKSPNNVHGYTTSLRLSWRLAWRAWLKASSGAGPAAGGSWVWLRPNPRTQFVFLGKPDRAPQQNRFSGSEPDLWSRISSTGSKFQPQVGNAAGQSDRGAEMLHAMLK